jgi:hypothetical protein
MRTRHGRKQRDGGDEQWLMRQCVDNFAPSQGGEPGTVFRRRSLCDSRQLLLVLPVTLFYLLLQHLPHFRLGRRIDVDTSHERKAVSTGDLGGCASSRFWSVSKPRTHNKITGCLSSTGHPDEYQLVDERGVTNLVYSVTVHLDSYVGQSVTLTGDQSAMPGTDTGTAQPSPHFKVLKVHAASGNCKK